MVRITRASGWAVRVVQHAAHLAFERGQVSTAAVPDLSVLGLAQPDRRSPNPTPWPVVRRSLREMRLRPHDVLLDIGCGRGRVISYAARRVRARRMLGVDIGGDLVAHARANLARRPEQLVCRDVHFVQADATEFMIPDDVTCIYLYNPVVGDSFRAILANVTATLDRAPRDLSVVYAHPRMGEALAQSPRFTQVRTSRPRWLRRNDPGREIAVFRTCSP